MSQFKSFSKISCFSQFLPKTFIWRESTPISNYPSRPGCHFELFTYIAIFAVRLQWLVSHWVGYNTPGDKVSYPLKKVFWCVQIPVETICYNPSPIYADFMMREDMELIQKEQGELEKRKAELERQLAQRFLTQNQEAHIKSLAEKISIGLNNLDFTGKQELLRLLVEKVFYNGQSIEILTIIPLGEQLHPVHRRG